MKSRNIPNQLNNIDIKKLKQVCFEYMQKVAENGYVDDDGYINYVDDYFYHYIFEAAIEAIYGKDIWDFINYEEDIKE
jgi:hypothetical protein